MRSSKEFTIGAGMAILLSLPFSHAALSASNDVATNTTAASQLHQGDLVRLRSGGPLMTVNGIKGDQIECVWTDLGNGQPDDATFPAQVLQKF
jgi:uncharacterized protein YodC (DUF2158 family)